MDFLTDWLTNWLKELLISGIMGNLEGLFDTVNAKVGEIAVQVGTTPAAWHAFRNGDPADCRIGADLCCHLRADTDAFGKEQYARV